MDPIGSGNFWGTATYAAQTPPRRTRRLALSFNTDPKGDRIRTTLKVNFELGILEGERKTLKVCQLRRVSPPLSNWEEIPHEQVKSISSLSFRQVPFRLRVGFFWRGVRERYLSHPKYSLTYPDTLRQSPNLLF